MKRALGYLLFLANTRPGAERQAFYAMKGRLLRRYGRRAGEDVQELTYECWNCSGQGAWPSKMTTEWEECWKCGGDGVYSQRWVALDRWELGGRTFHNPRATLPGRPDQVTIRGRVRHPHMGWRATAAKWALFCWFHPGFVRQEISYRLRRALWRYWWWKREVMYWRNQRNYDEIPF